MNASKKVVVTGIGVASSGGTGAETLFSNLVEGKSGIAPIQSFDPEGLRSRIAGEVSDCDFTEHLDSRVRRRTARFAQLLLVSAKEALAQAELLENPLREKLGVVVGSGIGAIDTYEAEHRKFLAKGIGKEHPLTIPLVLPNMAAAAVARIHGLLGPNVCLTTACASGAHSIGTAFDWIRAGRADAVLAGSAESTVTKFCLDGYCQLRALSTRNEEPTKASRPFSKDRDGFVLAEGAGVLILESEEHALARGAPILAELVGYGAGSDGYHLTAPQPEGRGAIQAMEMALKDAGMTTQDIRYVNAHGTSTPLGDQVEALALKKVFQERAKDLVVHSTKSMTGHALGASAAIEAVVAVQTLRKQVMHPTINLEEPDPECDLDFVPEGARKADIDAVLTNSFAFGGHCASLIFTRRD